MYLIVGLGNPEEEYSKTRHNMGFNAINKIAEQYGIKVTKNKFQGLYESALIEGEKVILLKPQTYMNLSGNSVKEFVDFYKISKEEISAQLADKFLAQKLEIKPGDAILIRKRFVYDPGGRPLEWNIGYYRADSFVYTLEFEREV